MRAESRALARQWLTLQTRVEYDPTSTGAADVALVEAMGDSRRRDVYLNVAAERPARTLHQVLATCVVVPDPAEGEHDEVVGNLCAVAAALAVLAGNEPLARVCLDRAVRVWPEHQLAALLTQWLNVGAPVADLRRALLEDF